MLAGTACLLPLPGWGRASPGGEGWQAVPGRSVGLGATNRDAGDEGAICPLHAIALAIHIVGALALGAPGRAVAYGLVTLACPLMTPFLHGGHGGHGGHSGECARHHMAETNSSGR
ncbi:DUF2933 domain-containing protein [Micromonospora sp. MS34]|uniref:DUF2933 domain-containing protein n=1 Tax=Micromonospora sp. MS34 TaxID=3385971 RepID=UPI0039A3C843